jgi:predicted metal-dependent peptidase
MGRGPGSRLDVAINEAYGLAKMTGCVTFGMACDAAVHASTEVRSPADMMALARGGGGTDMRIGIKAAAEEKHRPDVIVLITDAETPWPTKAEMPKRSRLVVCVVGRSKWSYDNMPDYIKKHAVYVNGGNY